jgi:hypothetical protein
MLNFISRILLIGVFGGKATVFDNLIFDLLGMALAALCLAGLLAPSRRPSRRAISDI